MQNTEQSRALFAVALAGLMGGLAVISLFSVLTDYQERIDQAVQPERTVTVMAASRDLYPGMAIEADDLVAIEVPPRFLPSGVFLAPEFVIGQRPRERVLANEFVRASRLANPETGQGLNVIIPADMRAISVEINNGEALAGHLDPGSYVDVLATLTGLDADAPDARTVTLLQAVYVLAVNDQAGREQADTRSSMNRQTVTLLVDAPSAEQIAHAERTGELRLSLRNPTDGAILNSVGADLDRVLHNERLTAEAAEPVRTIVRPVVKPSPPPAGIATQIIRFVSGTESFDAEIPIAPLATESD